MVPWVLPGVVVAIGTMATVAVGGIIADAERQQATDREWSRTLLEPLTRASEPQDATEAQQKKLTPQPAGQPGSDTKA